MTEPFKLPDDEFDLLVSLQRRWKELTSRLGELHYQKKGIDAELILTDNAITKLDEERYGVVKVLQEKYGVGQVNLANGMFVPE